MTETEWIECGDPIAMLQFLFGSFMEMPDGLHLARKNLLLACACFARVSDLLPPEACVWQAHAAEAAEGRYTKSKLDGEGEEADWAFIAVQERADAEDRGRLTALLDLWTWTPDPTSADEESKPFWLAEREAQADLIREIYGNPFQPVRLDLRVFDRGGIIIETAEAIYRDRDFGRLGSLANMVEECGWADRQVLAHCRSVGGHHRGCWVIDLLLGLHDIDCYRRGGR